MKPDTGDVRCAECKREVDEFTAIAEKGRQVDLRVTSTAAAETRHYLNAAFMQQDVIDARVWSGIHFRKADEVGVAMGIEVGNWALDHYFAPTK